MLRIHRKENGEVVFTLSGQIDKEHIAELEALIARGRERPPYHPGPQRYDFDRSGWHRFSRSSAKRLALRW